MSVAPLGATFSSMQHLLPRRRSLLPELQLGFAGPFYRQVVPTGLTIKVAYLLSIHRLQCSVLFDPLWITVRHKIQSDVVLEERLETRQHQREPLSRVGHLFN